MSPRPGNLFTCELLVVLIKPLMTKLSPSPSDTLVSVRRMVSAGTVVPAMFTALAKSSSLTSGATFSAMRSRPMMVGVSVRRMPNSLYSIDTLSLPELGTGIGISPPARKLALCPFSATRLGRARV